MRGVVAPCYQLISRCNNSTQYSQRLLWAKAQSLTTTIIQVQNIGVEDRKKKHVSPVGIHVCRSPSDGKNSFKLINLKRHNNTIYSLASLPLSPSQITDTQSFSTDILWAVLNKYAITDISIIPASHNPDLHLSLQQAVEYNRVWMYQDLFWS